MIFPVTSPLIHSISVHRSDWFELKVSEGSHLKITELKILDLQPFYTSGAKFSMTSLLSGLWWLDLILSKSPCSSCSDWILADYYGSPKWSHIPFFNIFSPQVSWDNEIIPWDFKKSKLCFLEITRSINLRSQEIKALFSRDNKSF